MADRARSSVRNNVATLSAVVVMAISVSAVNARQNAVRPPPMPSDALVYSPLGTCDAVDSLAPHTPERVRIATWNIRAALSAPVDAIASELASMQADVVALQEVDLRTRRSGFVDQPEVLANALGFHYVFAASIKWDEGDYGLAVLSRWPIMKFQRHRLDSATATEPRIVLEATICADGQPLHLFDHHADGWVGSREMGFAELKDLVQPYMGRGFLVMGDFNEQPDGPDVRNLLGAGLTDLGAELGLRTENRRRIDYLLTDPTLARRASPARVWPTDKSDHYAMLANLEW